MKNLFLSAGLLIVSLVGFTQPVAKNLTASNGVYIGFYQYTPPDYYDGLKHPLIIFLHGIGERGDGKSQLSMVLNNPIPAYLTASATMKFTYAGVTASYCVLAPQLSTNYGDWQDFYVDEMINYAKLNMNIDTNRIYLTGLSLGGGGTWHYATSSLAHAQQLAAIAPVCGTCSMVSAANIANANLPVWAFHAQDDGVVGVGCTTSQVTGVNALKPGLALQTIYGSGNHYIWGRAYDMGHPSWDAFPVGTVTQNPNVYEWFLQYTRNGNAGGGVPTPTPTPTPTPAPNKPPVANPGSDAAITLPTSSVTLNGSASYDPDGTIIAYEWTQLTGPSQATIASPKSVSTTVSNLVQGTYTFKLGVWDNTWTPAYANVTVTVNAAPAPTPAPTPAPVAKAGGTVTLTLPTNSTTLNASTSTGNIVSYSWSVVSGPTQITLSNPAAASTTVSNLVQGTYTIGLKVTDANGSTSTDNATIIVNPAPAQSNKAPVSKAGSDVAITWPTNTATLDGTGSYDPDGYITSYAWTKISGPASGTISSASASYTTVTNLALGTYKFQLTVTDNAGATNSSTVNVIVNQPPVVKAGADVAITLPTNSVTLTGTAYDPDGTIAASQWSQVSGPAPGTIASPNALSTTISNLSQGTYQFLLTVWDNYWVPSSDMVVVTVNAAGSANKAPVANAGTNLGITLPSNSVTLTGTGSYDPDGTITSYAWSKISGPSQGTITNANTATATASGLGAGTYKFQLTVTDNNGATNTASMTVLVNQPPVAVPGANATITLPTNSVNLTGSGSYDPDGTIFVYRWEKITGPSQYSLSSTTTANTTVSNLIQGTYTFRLTVWDNYWYPSSADVTVTVNGTGVITARAVTAPAVEAKASTAPAANQLTIYPNPVTDVLNIRAITPETGASTLNIFDMSGKLVKKQSFSKGQAVYQQSLSVSSLTPGVYQMQVVVNNKTKMTTKFVKQ